MRYVAVVALAMLSGVSGCCRKPRVKPPVQIVRTVRECAERLPEWRELRVQFEECEGWEACLDGESADELAEYIEKAEAFRRAVEIECNRKETSEP